MDGQKTRDICEDFQEFSQAMNTKMLRAATEGHVHCLKEAIDGGADVNFLDPIATERYLKTTRDTETEYVDDSESDDDDPWRENDPPPKTALIHAVENNHIHCVELLIKSGADMHGSDASDRIPLHVTAEKGHHKIMDLLTKAGVDVDLEVPDYDTTPLMFAAQNGHMTCLKLLIKAGADVNKKDADHCTAYDHAMHNDHHECCQLFKV